jgi:hypothetical protein
VTSRDSLALSRRDSLTIDAALPLRGTYHPLGFLLHLQTNSQDVLDAAAESWSHYPSQVYPCDPIEFRVVVQPQGALAGIATHRAHWNLYSVVSDTDNFAAVDLKTLRASMFVSARTAAHRSLLRWLYVESLAYLLLAQRYAVPVHAACVARQGQGILLCGFSAAGKSTLAYACARAGWTYITDDGAFLLPGARERVAIGRHRQFRFRVDAPHLFPELEGYVIRARPNGKLSIEVPVTALPGISAAERATVARVVMLDRRDTGEPRLDPIPGEEAAVRMLHDMPSYGDEVNAMHERTVRNIVEVPTYRLRYAKLDDAMQLLNQIL